MLKSLKKIFFNKTILSLAGNGSAAILGFASFALMARSMVQETFGNWLIFITIVTLIELFRTGFLQTPLIKYISGADVKTQRVITGSCWLFALILTGVISLACAFASSIFSYIYPDSAFNEFFKWAGLLIILTLPYNFATWNLQSEMKFEGILLIRLMSLGGFVAFLILNQFLKLGENIILYMYIGIHGATSIVSLALNWCRIKDMKYASKDTMKELLNFGKFSMGTMIGANLLRSSGTLIIGVLMGASSVAIYNVALKVFEIVEIPLRSVVATALPNLARLVNTNNKKGLIYFFERSTGMVTIFLLPVILCCFIFAGPLVILLGGSGYSESVLILRIFTLFAVLLPLDRYSGITLDLLNKPVLNFQKILLMLVINILGDITVIYWLGELWTVAVVSVFTFSSGVIFGIYFLKRIHDFSIKGVIRSGIKESRIYAIKVLNKF